MKLKIKELLKRKHKSKIDEWERDAQAEKIKLAVEMSNDIKEIKSMIKIFVKRRCKCRSSAE